MAYVPWQKWRNLYEPCKGLQRGTIFEDLSKPFHGRGGCNR
ncbi:MULTISPECIES: spore coat associated protein CotJA [Lachnospiraceae]|nr:MULTISPECIES: spore coat associated protein CotJA [Clostridia]